METGVSLYFSGGLEKNEQIIQKMITYGARYAFTSLHIPEETGVDYQKDARHLLKVCKENGIHLIVDVGPETLEKLGVKRIDELEELGITHVRLDYGFSARDTVRLAEKFHVVFNASTITETDIQEWKDAGADFSRFTACHNFYPKQFTALSMKRVREINERLKGLGFTTIGFVPGDKELRGPLMEGLPTVEEHRRKKEDVLLNMLELYYDGLCDMVLVGDVDIHENNWKALMALSKGYVELKADIQPEYAFIRERIHHDRVDSSEYVIRSQESREYHQMIKAQKAEERKRGSISVSNEAYLRYMGELEIARVDLPAEPRVNVIGQVEKESMKYLPYIQQGMGFRFV